MPGKVKVPVGGNTPTSQSATLLFLHLLFTVVLSQWDYFRGKYGLPSPEKASCNSNATQPTMHSGCFSVSIIHQTLTWTMGS